MRRRGPRKPRPPLDGETLNELMLAYVARFATSKAKLTAYLVRKLRERGWSGNGEPPVEALVAKAVHAGFVDDSAYALGKARSLTARGYGSRRVNQALQAAGIEDCDRQTARDQAHGDRVESALNFARRRRFGPFASEPADRTRFEKQLAAMVRAGHGLTLAKAILTIEPGSEIDHQALDDQG